MQRIFLYENTNRSRYNKKIHMSEQQNIFLTVCCHIIIYNTWGHAPNLGLFFQFCVPLLCSFIQIRVVFSIGNDKTGLHIRNPKINIDSKNDALEDSFSHDLCCWSKLLNLSYYSEAKLYDPEILRYLIKYIRYIKWKW